MKLSDAAIDIDRLENGAWVENLHELFPELAGLKVKVRGANNRDWRKLHSKLLDAVPRKKRMNGGLDPDEQDRVTNTLLLNVALIDWDGLDRDDGQPIPYNKDDAAKILNDPQYRKIRDGVLWAANVVADQQAAEVEEDAKN